MDDGRLLRLSELSNECAMIDLLPGLGTQRHGFFTCLNYNFQFRCMQCEIV